ncbi:hypothetical protein GmarT_41090 [Gimesia maris]|uniref:Uncharacterized protein n=1 Tax=Gimesia maris TaxID=122 RepID=A0ABX5YRE2_9PLAN|nr:hypothetical protein GmarT_41090 [Gimesia maris]
MFGFGISTRISLLVGAAVIYQAVLSVYALFNGFKSRAALVGDVHVNGVLPHF